MSEQIALRLSSGFSGKYDWFTDCLTLHEHLQNMKDAKHSAAESYWLKYFDFFLVQITPILWAENKDTRVAALEELKRKIENTFSVVMPEARAIYESSEKFALCRDFFTRVCAAEDIQVAKDAKERIVDIFDAACQGLLAFPTGAREKALLEGRDKEQIFSDSTRYQSTVAAVEAYDQKGKSRSHWFHRFLGWLQGIKKKRRTCQLYGAVNALTTLENCKKRLEGRGVISTKTTSSTDVAMGSYRFSPQDFLFSSQALSPLEMVPPFLAQVPELGKTLAHAARITACLSRGTTSEERMRRVARSARENLRAKKEVLNPEAARNQLQETLKKHMVDGAEVLSSSVKANDVERAETFSGQMEALKNALLATANAYLVEHEDETAYVEACEQDIEAVFKCLRQHEKVVLIDRREAGEAQVVALLGHLEQVQTVDDISLVLENYNTSPPRPLQFGR